MKTQQSPADLIAAARTAVEANRRTYVAQAVADAKECPVCGEELLFATVRCEPCQAEVDHDRAVDDAIDCAREERGDW